MPSPVYISKLALRKLFNEQNFPERIRRGEISERVIASARPVVSSRFPEGTCSQRVAYIDGRGRQCAVVHRFLLPDGHLGASRQPDPKELLVDDVLYRADPTDTS
jgi:hypothetical protein